MQKLSKCEIHKWTRKEKKHLILDLQRLRTRLYISQWLQSRTESVQYCNSIATTWSYQSDIRVPASRYVSDLWSPFGSHTFFPGFASSRPTITHFPTSEWLNVTTLCAPLTSQRTHTCINTHSTWILVFFILHWNACYKRLIQVTLTINYKNVHNDSALTKYYSQIIHLRLRCSALMLSYKSKLLIGKTLL